MLMVVQCKCCMTEYRLDAALLKGAKGACIRCPKCRGRIIVENPRAPQAAPSMPHRVTPPTAPPIGYMVPPPIAPPVAPPIAPPIAPPVAPPAAPPIGHMVPPSIAPPVAPPIAPPIAPPAAIETAFPRILLEAPEGMTSHVPRDRRAEGADLSGMIRSDPPDIPGGKALRLKELFIHPSAVEGEQIPGGGDDGPVEIRSPRPGWNPPPRRPLYRRPLFLAVAISILLLAGGTIFFVDGNFGRTSSDSVIPVRARSAPENAVFDVGNLKGDLNKQASGEPLYVVKGTVTNVGKALSSGIRIEVTLLGKDNQAIVKSGTFAGNVIDESLIPHMTRVRIEGFLGMRYGEGDVNRDIPTGKNLPFMVVFFDPPEGVESFRVKAIDADEADRVDSHDGKESGTRASNQPSIRLN
jgi:Protein of unknown function (DUF3426)